MLPVLLTAALLLTEIIPHHYPQERLMFPSFFVFLAIVMGSGLYAAWRKKASYMWPYLVGQVAFLGLFLVI
jgi:hypothetical protein